MLALVEAALAGLARKTWEATDALHRDSWVSRCRDSYTAKSMATDSGPWSRQRSGAT